MAEMDALNRLPRFLVAALLGLSVAACAVNKPIVQEEEKKEEVKKEEPKKEEAKPAPKPLAPEAVYFEYNVSSLSADAKAALKRNVEQLLAHPEAKIAV